MIKHIVMWRFNADVSEMDKMEMQRQLEALKELVPTVVELEIGRNRAEGPAAWDIVLYSGFNSMEGLNAYAVHPEHLKVADFVRSLVCERAVADYEV